MKIHIQDRSYQSFVLDDNTTNIEIDPKKEKLFDQDSFFLNENKECIVVNSPIRNMKNLCGILILNGNKTYGKTINKKKFYYRCIPNNKHLPIFLIPYAINIGFDKSYQNKFILFQFHEWKKEHPFGMITEMIGDVNKEEFYYEYQLYCKSIHHSMKSFIKKMYEKSKELNSIETIKRKSTCLHENQETTNEYIFSIDPIKCLDYDDALSITQGKENNDVCITIYITNVCLLMESFELWNSFSDNVSTIYLPNQNRVMLPSILSEKFGSLKKKEERFVFAFTFYFNEKGQEKSEKNTIENKLITVNENFIYEEEKLQQNRSYQNLFEFTNNKVKIKDSHELVAYWMIYTNKYVANYMKLRQRGIFRTSQFRKTETETETETETKINQLQLWRNSSCQYVLFQKDDETTEYLHITSPLRRLVDLLNQLILTKELFPSFLSLDACFFLNEWTKKIDFINRSMKSIRKVQKDCWMMNSFFHHPDIIKNKNSVLVYDGIVLEKKKKDDKNDVNVKKEIENSYTIYLETMNFISKIKVYENLEIGSKHKFQVFLFEREHEGGKKIQLSLYQSIV